jgi:hypothetical protein
MPMLSEVAAKEVPEEMLRNRSAVTAAPRPVITTHSGVDPPASPRANRTTARRQLLHDIPDTPSDTALRRDTLGTLISG